MEEGKAALILSIEEDAHAEEEKILTEAEGQAMEKRRALEKRVAAIWSIAQKEANEQAEMARRRILSGAELEIKRRSLHTRDLLMRDILDRVESKLQSMIGDPGYRSVLVNWITEAAIGLDVDSAEVNASEKERVRIDDVLLSEVGARVRAEAGKPMTLRLSGEPPLRFQGVVLTAAGGRVAYNNQVKTRMLRSQREIQMLIYNAAWTGNPKESI